MKILSLFSGIGAFEKALSNLGVPFELVNYCEIDKFASKSYLTIHNIDESKNLGDITKVDVNFLSNFDLMTWGFPCQDISVAGKQKGIEEGTRSGLYYQGLRILKAKLPKYSIIENVKNLTSKKFKNEFESILKDLENLGYTNYWKVLNAKDFGIPQNRERVFIISIRGDHKPFEWPAPFDNGLRLKDLLEANVDEKYYISDEAVRRLTNNSKGFHSKIQNQNEAEVANALFASMDRPDRGCNLINPCKKHDPNVLRYERTEYGKEIRKQYESGEIDEKIGNMREPKPRTDGISNTLSTVQKDNMLVMPCLTPDRQEKRQNGRRFKEDGEPMFTLTSQDRHGVLQKVGHLNNSDSQGNKVYSLDGLAASQTSQSGGLGAKTGLYLTEYRVRKLTPKECWRLMKFDDEDINKCINAGISNSQLYKQAGNSICVNVLEEIFKKLF